MQIACGTVHFRKLALTDALENIKKAGYDYVEPQATAPFCPHIDVDKDSPGQFRSLLSDLGFKGATALWSTHGAIIPDEESLEYVPRCIEWAAKAGIPVVNAGDGFKPKVMSDQEAWNILADRLPRILEAAEKHKVYLAIEPHGTFSLTSEGLKRMMSLSDSPYLGINYDTANVHRATYVETKDGKYTWKSSGEKQDEVKVLSDVIERVVHVHVKDVKGPDAVALGTGEVNLLGCLEVLKNAGYAGAVSLETEGEAVGQAAQQLAVDSRLYLVKTLKGLGVG